MPSSKHRGPIPRRRRHDDDGEEEGSAVGDVQGYASSEGSVNTDVEEDGHVSAASIDDEAHSIPSPILGKQHPSQNADQEQRFKTTAETEAMLNELKIKHGETIEEVNYDDSTNPENHPAPSQTIQPQGPSRKPRAVGGDRFDAYSVPSSNRDHFPNDDRSRGQTHTGQSGPRGRGRGFVGAIPRGNFGNFGAPTDNTSKQWTHDLHETVNKPAEPKSAAAPAATGPLPSAPNRSFSTTTVLGNVPVQISIPGTEKKTLATMVKKHYTLLPQHRPPLRSDKPVRISIPDEHPRYIFPSKERSFIFIPRAMRPNQHQFKGRGRGSFHGSRRTSVYAASVYTPSIGMSRRPSIAASQSGSGVQTPTGPPIYAFQPGVARPVVRMPFPGVMPFVPSSQNAEVYLGDNAAIVHSLPPTLPMHQPVPQKTVSVADIESPTVKAPAQQSQQPFHQQIPQSVSDAQSKMPHIPEGAVYAQPFQPYPAMQPGFYGMPYTPNHMMMQPLDGAGFPVAMGGPVMASMQPAPTQQSGPVAHEQSGMVYYYDPLQQQIAPGFVPHMMNMNVIPPGGYYYPPFHNQQMFYQ